MKLFIQIPCLNEETTLPLVFEKMPKKINGIDQIEFLIIDDGSTDKTIEIAKNLGVKHFVIHDTNQGLARSFSDGVDYCLSHGADIVVNTDGDNQYPSDKIADLVQPIIGNEFDIVIGDRQTSKIAHFSAFKKLMQRFGSWVVNQAAGTDLPDAASGFRAYSKEALLRINIVTQFSYCMETIIQAGNKKIGITSIPIETNKKTRESRLFKNIWQHMNKSAQAIMRSFIMFRPHLIFLSLGLIFLILGIVPFARFGYYFLNNDGAGHMQSLVFGSAMIVASMLSFSLLVIADLLKTNRILLENQLERTKKIQYQESRQEQGQK